VTNLGPVSAELGFEPGAEPEAILAAVYRRWGVDMLERLRGRFALAIWDAEQRTGVLAVDPLGVRSLFTHEGDGELNFAFEARDLVAALPASPSPSPIGVARWLADGLVPADATMYENVRRLEGGQAIVLGPGGWRRLAYWRPRFDPLRLTRPEAVEVVRASVETAVRERVGTRTGVLLSGGIDSASVAAFATRAASASSVRAYSLVFPGRPSMDEDRLIGLVASHLGIPGVRLAFQRGSMLGGSLDYLERWSLPSVSPNLVLHVPLLHHAAEEGVVAVLDGQGGDELFGCAPYLLADRIRRARFRSAAQLARSLPGAASSRETFALVRELGFKGGAPHAVHRLVRRLRARRGRSPAWLRPEVATLADEARDPWAWKRLPGPRWWAERAEELTVRRLEMGAHDFLRHKNALAGLEGHHPFLDDSGLVELMLRLPPELSFDVRYDRPLLRAAVENLVPDEIRLRREKSYFNELFRETLGGPDLPALHGLLGDPRAEINAYVHPELVRSLLLDAPAARRGGMWAWAVWRLVTAECWLRHLVDPGLPRHQLERLGLQAPRYAFVGTARS
jgi:asparagine synthase (glutamine-hydrolysing)